MLLILSVPLFVFFLYQAFKFYRQKHYKNFLAMGLISFFLLLVTLGCLGLGYLWSTYPGEINL
jgi:cell division protein FtsX